MKLLTKITVFLMFLIIFCGFLLNSQKTNAAGELKEVDTIPSHNYTVVIDAGHGGSDPGSVGYKTKVHESDLENKPKFVMITSDANKFLYQECAELDIISVVAKPISIERINLILDDIIEMKEEPLIKNNTSSYTKDSFFTKIIRIFKGGKHE